MTMRPSPDALIAHLEGESVLLNARTHEYFRLNQTAQAIWKQLERGEAFDAIVAHLMREFDVSAAEAEQDARELIDQLRAAQLIEIEPEA